MGEEAGCLSTESVMQCIVGPGAWPPRSIFKTSSKMVHYDGCFNIFPGKQRGNKCLTTRLQHINMFIARNNHEISYLAHYIAGETMSMYLTLTVLMLFLFFRSDTAELPG